MSYKIKLTCKCCGDNYTVLEDETSPQDARLCDKCFEDSEGGHNTEYESFFDSDSGL